MDSDTGMGAALLLSTLRYEGEVDWQRVATFKSWLLNYQKGRMGDVAELMKTATMLPEERIDLYITTVTAVDERSEFTLTLSIKSASKLVATSTRALIEAMCEDIGAAMYRLLLAPRKFVVALDGTAELVIARPEPQPSRRLSGPAPTFCGQSLN